MLTVCIIVSPREQVLPQLLFCLCQKNLSFAYSYMIHVRSPNSKFGDFCVSDSNDLSCCSPGLDSPYSCRQTSWSDFRMISFWKIALQNFMVKFFCQKNFSCSVKKMPSFTFQASLGLNLLFFNLMGALWLVATEGIPIIITAYLIQVLF